MEPFLKKLKEFFVCCDFFAIREVFHWIIKSLIQINQIIVREITCVIRSESKI